MKKSGGLIYLDNNATTRVDSRVFDEMEPWLREEYGNPSSAYGIGRKSSQALAAARERVASLIQAQPEEILFTSCGSESINTAIRSAISHDPDRTHVVTSAVEHSATIKLCEHLAKRGHEITLLPVDSLGRLDPERLKKSIREDTALVSLLWANNETGVLFPVAEIAAICREKKVPLHIDAVQAVGKLPINVHEFPISFLSLSGHKLHCPKGVGALFIRRRTRFTPWLIGGSQEEGRRGGTQNVAFITALGKAAELAADGIHDETVRIRALRDRLETTLQHRLSGVHVNGDPVFRLPNTTNLRFEGIESEGALMLFDKEGLCCSAGSACTSGSVHPSHVLTAMGVPRDGARASLRFSLGRFTTEEDIENAEKIVIRAVNKLRSL